MEDRGAAAAALAAAAWIACVGVRESKRLCSSPLFFWYFTISPLDFAPFVFCKIW
jgi:hypothetical protein